jgi:2,5-furandicarboxylate decarboxylase 1
MRMREFLATLEKADDVASIDYEVTREAIPFMIKAEEAGRNRAIVFRRIRGHSMPLVANLYGTYRRYGIAVGGDEHTLWSRINDAVANPARSTTVADGPCFEVVHREPDITQLLPVLQYHPLDAGPYITSGLAFMTDPETGRRNISFIRLMVKGPRKLGFNPKSRHNKDYYQKIALAGKRMEVAFCLGAPTEMLAAGAQWIPDECDEVEVATALAAPEHRRELAMVRCKTVDIEIPAGTEIVLEGVVSTELEPEGPFGDWTDAYARPQMKPTLHVTCVSHRSDAVYQTIMPGRSKEQIILTIARFQPEIEAIVASYPEVRMAVVPEYGLGRLAIVAAADTPRNEEIMRRFLGIQCINRVVLVNEDVNVDSAEDVLWAISNRILETRKVVIDSCVDEWWNHLKLGIDTTVDLNDIRHKRPTLEPFQGRTRVKLDDETGTAC